MFFRIILYLIYFPIIVLFSADTFAVDNFWDDIKDKENPQAYIIYGVSKQKNHPHIADKVLQKAYILAKQQNNNDLMAKAILEQAQTAKIHKNYAVAKQYLIKAEFISSSLDNNTLKVDILANMSTVLRYLDLTEESFSYIQKALSVANESLESNLILKSLQIKARLLQSMSRYDESISTYLLAHRYTSAASNKDKVKLFRNTANAYNKIHDYKSGVMYYVKALNILEEIRDIQSMSKTLIDISKTHAKAGEFSQSIENGNRALAVAREYKSETDIVHALVGLSIAYRKISSYEDALTHGLEALKIYQKNNDVNGIAASANTIGLIYFYLNQNENAKHCFKQVLNLPKNEIKAKFRAAAQRDLAKLLFQENQHQQALQLSNESYSLYGRVGNKSGQASVQTSLGSFYYQMGRLNDAINAYNTSIDLFHKLDDVWNKVAGQALLAKVLVEKDALQSIDLAKKSLDLATKIGAKSIIEDAYSALILAEEKRGDYKQALSYAKRKEAIINEVRADAINKRSAEMYIILNVEKQERSIALLKQEKAVMALELDNRDGRSKLFEQEKIIIELKEKMSLITLSVAIMAIFLALLLIGRVYFNINSNIVIAAITIIILLLFSISAISA